MEPPFLYSRPSEDDDAVEKTLVKTALDGNLRQLKGVTPFVSCAHFAKEDDIMEADDKRQTFPYHAKATEFVLSKGVSVDIDCSCGASLIMAATNDQHKTCKFILDHHRKAGILGGGKRKNVGAEDTAEILQKAPRLDLPMDHLAGSNAAALLELSSNSEGKKCNHVKMGIVDINEIHDEILSTKEPPICEESYVGIPRTNYVSCVGGDIMVCTECNGHFCAGLSAKSDPQGHALSHANQDNHWVGLLYNDPFDGYCFICKCTLNFRWSDAEHKGNYEVSDDAGVHVSEFANGNGYTIRGMPNLGLTCYMNALVQCLLALGNMRTNLLLDAPPGPLGACLKDLFVETSTRSHGSEMMMLKTQSLLNAIRNMDASFRGVQDSHELFMSMCRYFHDEDQKKLRCMEAGAPRPVYQRITTSIFSVQLCVGRLCRHCQNKAV